MFFQDSADKASKQRIEIYCKKKRKKKKEKKKKNVYRIKIKSKFRDGSLHDAWKEIKKMASINTAIDMNRPWVSMKG